METFLDVKDINSNTLYARFVSMKESPRYVSVCLVVNAGLKDDDNYSDSGTRICDKMLYSEGYGLITTMHPRDALHTAEKTAIISALNMLKLDYTHNRKAQEIIKLLKKLLNSEVLTW
jgi:hypothetical protein